MLGMCLTVALSLVGLLMATLPSKQKSNEVAIPLYKHHSSFLKANDGVDFNVLDTHALYISAKMARGLNNYEKNTGTKHPAAKNASFSRKRGTEIPLKTFIRAFWYASITIGTPPKSFFVDADTGSADLVVLADSCDSASCNDHTRWDPAESPSAQSEDMGCSVAYADGSTVKGDQYADNVTIAGFMAKTQTICVATKYSPEFSIDKFPADGVMGLGFSSISDYGAIPLFETLVNDKVIPEKAFSFYLTSTGGELYIGGANHDRYKDDFVFSSVTEEGFWQVELERIRGKGKGSISLDDIGDVIIDTGCSFIIGDETRIKKLHDALGGKHHERGFYKYPCNSFPDVSLTFKGKSFAISTISNNIGRIDGDPHNCLSGIIGRDSEASEFWSIGGVFLQNVYTSFDYGNKQVGFAEHA